MKEIQEWNGGKARITVWYGTEIRNIITKCDFFLLVLELMKSLQQLGRDLTYRKQVMN